MRAAEAVRDGKAAMVSAGNTGAAMASALLRMGRIKGSAGPPSPPSCPSPTAAEPPSSWTPAPTPSASPSGWSSSRRWGLSSPATASDSTSPGSACCRSARSTRATRWSRRPTLLETAPGVCFIGNVEGRDILTDDVDIVVTDGFSGNVVLKALEGALSSIMAAVERALTATDELAAHFEPIRPALEDLYERLEPESFGEAMLLGVDGVCIISHGSSSAKEPQRHQDGAGDGGRGGRRGGAGAVSAG